MAQIKSIKYTNNLKFYDKEQFEKEVNEIRKNIRDKCLNPHELDLELDKIDQLINEMKSKRWNGFNFGNG